MTNKVRAHQIRVAVKQTRAFFVLKHQNDEIDLACERESFVKFELI